MKYVLIGSKLHKKNCQCSFCKASQGELTGKNHPMYNPLRHKIHHRIESNCNNRISWPNWLYGNKRCQSCSDKGKRNPMFSKSPQWKRIKYYDILMRSTWEIWFAQFLDLSGIKYQYESKRFDLENMTYLPDFYIPEWNLYIEIKGYWPQDRIKKFKRFKRLYPQIKIKVLMQKDLQKLGVIR